MNTPEEQPNSDEAQSDETEAPVQERDDEAHHQMPEVNLGPAQLMPWFRREGPYVIAAYCLVAVLIVNTVQSALTEGGKQRAEENAGKEGESGKSKTEQTLKLENERGEGKENEMVEDQQKAPAKKKRRQGGITLTPAQVEQLVTSFPDLAIFVGLIGLAVGAALLIGTGLFGWWIIQKLQDREPLQEEGAIPWAKCRWGFWDVLKVAVMYFFFLVVTASGIRLLCIDDGLRASYEALTQIQQGLILQLPGSVLIIGVMLHILKSERGYDLDELGYTFRWTPVAKGVLGYLAASPIVLACAFVGTTLIQYVGSEKLDHPIAGELIGENPLWSMVMMVFFACVLAPAWEECFFRGMLYRAIRKWCSLPISMVISATCFSMLHGNLSHLLPIFALGLLLAYLYEKTQSIWSCIAAHVVFNTGSMVLLFTIRFMLRRLDTLNQGKQMAALWF
ncbi:MAG: type II CAAX endopeptidase family protein [Planctomycetota bacterium]|nr:type II CAAX endopeptidase family protein [Planctomycetota bacterium]